MAKLEAAINHGDTMLVVWRRPEEAIADAVARVDFIAGARIVCLEWHGSGPLPDAKWQRNITTSLTGDEAASLGTTLRRIHALTKDEAASLDTTLRLPGTKHEERGERKRGGDPDIELLSDDEMLYRIFGVPT